MTEPSTGDSVAVKILLATDLSARCDRALDRAAQLVRQWDARLYAVHALEPLGDDFDSRLADVPGWRGSTTRSSDVAQQLAEDIDDEQVAATIIVEEGGADEVVLEAAQRESVDLVITGVAHEEPFGRMALGRTVEHLVRRANAPVLVVRNRARTAYRNIVVATDFSEHSRHALHVATRFLPHAQLTLFHAYDPVYAGWRDSESSPEAGIAIARRDCEAFLAATGLPEAVRTRINIAVAYGAPAPLLRDHVAKTRADLVVLGTQGRSAIVNALLGSTAALLLHSLPCDVMLVRAPVTM